MTGVSTLGLAMTQIDKIKEQQAQFTMLSIQLSSGKKAQSFSGLGNDILTDKRARADFKSLNTYIDNIKNADRRMTLMASAIKQFKQQAQNFMGALIQFGADGVHQKGDQVLYDDPLTPNVDERTLMGMTSDEPDGQFTTLQSLATNIYGFMVDLVNTKENDRYVFSGADMTTPPLQDSGTLEAAISSLLTQWKAGAITTDNLAADLRDRTTTGGNADALTDTIVGYSSALTAGNAGKIFARVQQNTEIDYTTLGNDQSFRDILVAVSYIKNENLPPIADTYIPPNVPPGVPDVQGAPGATVDEMKENFYAMFNGLAEMVNGAIKRMDEMSLQLETAHARIKEIQISHEESQNVLLSTVSDVEDADPTEVAIKLNSLQIQLSASMAVTAKLQDLSLVNFLFGR